MKNFFLTFCGSLLFSIAAFSQNQFVEVIVSDTVHLKPLSYAYRVSTGDRTEFMGMKFPTGKDDENSSGPKVSISEVEAKLKKEKFNLQYEENTTYSVDKTGKDEHALIVTLKSKPELQRLYDLLRSMKGVSGSVESVSFEPSDKYARNLFKKIFDKAKSEASMIASASGHQLGELLQVTEVGEDSNLYSNAVEKMSKKMAVNFFGDEGISSKEYERKFQFRFSLK